MRGKRNSIRHRGRVVSKAKVCKTFYIGSNPFDASILVGLISDFFFCFCQKKFQLFYKKLLINWINSLIKHEKKILGKINYIFCNDKYLLLMNNKYLNHNFYTDVITFNYVKDTKISGEIFISIDRVKENALKWGVSFEKELYRIMVHGVLHLLAYTDNDRFIMQNKENFYLDLLFFKIKKCYTI